MRNRAWLMGSALVFAVGCGNNNGNPDGSGVDATMTADAATEASTGNDTGVRDAPVERAMDNSACSVTAPTEGDMCSMFDYACDYGDDPRPECRPRYTCCNFQWQSTVTPTCVPLANGSCPEHAPMTGQVCDLENNFCPFGTQHCFCNRTAGGALNWLCYAPTDDPGCPSMVPVVGTRCPTFGLQCNYHRPGIGGFVVCGQDANHVTRWQDHSSTQPGCH